MQPHVTTLCTLWLQEMHAAFVAESSSSGKPRLLLTAAVPAGKSTIDNGYEVAEIAQYAICLSTK